MMSRFLSFPHSPLSHGVSLLEFCPLRTTLCGNSYAYDPGCILDGFDGLRQGVSNFCCENCEL